MANPASPYRPHGYDSALTRRRLLHLAGASTLGAALAGALRAEGQTLPDSTSSAAARPFADTTAVSIGASVLRVRDLDRMTRYYRNVLGLALRARSDTRVQLGTQTRTLLELHALPGASPAQPSDAGLFHNAFLMPTRRDLARWLVHAAQLRIPLSGFADHSVSEAIYLDDPEGNGIEVYADRPQSSWEWTGDMVTMGTFQLDIDNLLALTDTGRDDYTDAPGAMVLGHIHLRVGDVARGRAFYGQTLGLGLALTRGLSDDAAFLASGGYHHHLAVNSWQSRGAGVRREDTTGLDGFSLLLRAPELLAAQPARLQAAGAPVQMIAGGVETRDPWGTRLRLLAG